MESMPAWACATLTPGRRRPITLSQCTKRSLGIADSGISDSGAKASVASVGKRTDAGSTPKTVKLLPSSRTLRPAMAGSPPNRLRQAECERTTTWFLPGSCSSGPITRPTAAPSPSVAKKPALT